MVRVGRLMERRHLRRAAEQALTDRTLGQILGTPTEFEPDPDTVPIRITAPTDDLYELLHSNDEPSPVDETERSEPWYRTKPAMIAFVTAVAAVVASGVFVVQTPTTATDESTGVAPTAPPTAASPKPAPSSVQPVPLIAPPPPPPPPPPPAAPANPAPVFAGQWEQAAEQAPRPGPQLGVTRAPISAEPPPPPTPQYDQGDGRRAPRRGWR